MLTIKNINKSYGIKQALKDICINFDFGQSTALIGESGSGKTTLAKMITGIETPDSGQIYLEDQLLLPLKKRNFDICTNIQYIFQDPYSALEKNHTVKQTMEETRRICRRYRHNCMDITESLNYVDPNLVLYLDKKTDIPSGGQKQKLCIARALMTYPKVLISDECTSMLDKQSSIEIYTLLNKIKKSQNIILISILHDPDFLEDKWDNAAVFKDGSVVEQGKFFNFHETARHPYSKKLIEACNYFKYKGDTNEQDMSDKPQYR